MASIPKHIEVVIKASYTAPVMLTDVEVDYLIDTLRGEVEAYEEDLQEHAENYPTGCYEGCHRVEDKKNLEIVRGILEKLNGAPASNVGEDNKS